MFVEAVERLENAQRVMVTCHLGPDGDALGSLIALGALLEGAGRQVTLYNPDLVPRYLKWLPFSNRLVRHLPADAKFDLTVVMDCGDRKLLGPNFPGPEITGPLLVLDHHAASRPFGEIYLCDPQASSVGVLVARLARALGWLPTPEAALGMYVSIVSDTGGFRYANTNAEAFQIAADLVAERGVDPWTVTRAMSEQVPLARYRLLAAALGGIELEARRQGRRDDHHRGDGARGRREVGAHRRPGELRPRAGRRRVRISHLARARRRHSHFAPFQGDDQRRRGLRPAGRRRPPRRGGLHPRCAARRRAGDRAHRAGCRSGGARHATRRGIMTLDGILVIDKPAGITSADVVARVKRQLSPGGRSTLRFGHTGTLDPMATGVLPIVVGEGTKIAAYLLADDKEYEGELELGLTTTTLDVEGEVVTRGDASQVGEDALRAAMASWLGDREQIPPMYSALKQNGKRLYELARKGIEVEREARKIHIAAFDLLSFEHPRARFRVACTKGTYVRSLVRDVGEALGCGATLSALRRTRAGRFDLSHALPLAEVSPATAGPRMIAVADAVSHLPHVALDALATAAVRHGKPLAAPAALVGSPDPAIRLMAPDGSLAALADIAGARFRYLRVFPERSPSGG